MILYTTACEDICPEFESILWSLNIHHILLYDLYSSIVETRTRQLLFEPCARDCVSLARLFGRDVSSRVG